jgi:hypothetical protein
MVKNPQTSASEDGIALFKALGLVALAVALVTGGSLAGAFGGHGFLAYPFGRRVESQSGGRVAHYRPTK